MAAGVASDPCASVGVNSVGVNSVGVNSVGVNSVGAKCVGEPVTPAGGGVAAGAREELELWVRQCLYSSATSGSGDAGGFIETALL
jgi:hypothetical protein